MIAVDASAVCAIALHETEREAFIDRINLAAGAVISPLGLWEAKVSLQRRLGASSLLVDRLITEAGMAVATVERADAELAFDAWRRFGKGQHAASLNFGDCFAYALAKSRGLPLLYKGEDFAKTDVASAL